MNNKLRIIRLLYALCSLSFALYANDADVDSLRYSHYDVQVRILPGEQFIGVTGSLKYLVLSDTLNDLTFNLHKELTIENFSVNGDDSYRMDTSKLNVVWLPDAITIVYPTGNKFRKGDVLDVKFSYSGTITQWPVWSANVIGADWTELGLYFPWYPTIADEFTYKVSVDIGPGYNVFALGTATETNNKKVFETNVPVKDLVICASKDLVISETRLSGQAFQIVNTTLSTATVDSVHADIQQIYRAFNNLFGDIQLHNMCLVVSKREKGGGYARKGALFLSGLSDKGYLDNRIAYKRYLAHELAHFWWTGAPLTWEDWLNESFAEYSALMLIRDIHSREEFDRRMNAKRNESLNTPPIWGLPRNDPQATEVLYSKGVVLLSELEQKTGTDKFLEICRARVDQKVNTTAGFLNLLNNIAGKDIAGWFERELRYF